MNSPVLAACAVLFTSLIAVTSWSQDDAVAAVSVKPSVATVRVADVARDRQGRPVRVVLPSPF